MYDYLYRCPLSITALSTGGERGKTFLQGKGVRKMYINIILYILLFRYFALHPFVGQVIYS